MAIGPIAPGASQDVSMTIGPTKCIGGSYTDKLCDGCGMDAKVDFVLRLAQTGGVPAVDLSKSDGIYYAGYGVPAGVWTTPVTCTN